MITRECPKCGAQYELEEIKIMFRDKDSLECDFCGTTYMKWNGGSFFVVKRIISKPSVKKYNK